MRLKIRIFSFGILIVAAAAPAADPTPASEVPPAVPGIIGRALVGRQGEADLRYLSDRIGGRLTGSEASARAIAWAADRMRAIGLEDVHTEAVRLRRGWERGPASLEVTAPVRRELRVVSYGWTGSTPPDGIDAEIVPVDIYRLDAETKSAASWKGKVVFSVRRGEKPAGWSLRAATLEGLVRKAREAGAAAVALSPLAGAAGGMQLPHTSALVSDDLDAIPVVSVTPEGQGTLERLLTDGPVRVHLRVGNRATAGPIESANVVGEIRGRSRPEEIVVVGAHLDSWDLADGATDDGFGVACVLAAADAVRSAPSPPLRTIRFVLFTAEEERFLGSLAYVRAHAAEMPDVVAALVLDDGSGPIREMHAGGRTDSVPAMRRFVGELRGLGPISIDDEVEAGTDTLSFTLAGVAAIAFGQDSPDYDRTHHSEADTFDKIDVAMIPRDTAILAAAAWWVAERPARLAEPWTGEQTGKLLAARNLEDGLRFYGLWPFGRGAAPSR